MEVLSSILGKYWLKLAALLVDPSTLRSVSMLQFQKILEDLEMEMEKLMDLSNEVKHQQELVDGDGGLSTTEVNKWLTDVEEFVTKVNLVRAGAAVDNERPYGCLYRCSEWISTVRRQRGY